MKEKQPLENLWLDTTVSPGFKSRGTVDSFEMADNSFRSYYLDVAIYKGKKGTSICRDEFLIAFYYDYKEAKAAFSELRKKYGRENG